MAKNETLEVLNEILDTSYKEFKNEIKVYNAFSAVSEDNPNMDKEVFKKESLVDPLEKLPTLQEYVKRYVATGDLSCLPFRDNEPVDELLPGEDEEDFSSPLYDKDADYDDIIDASKVEGVKDVKDAYIKAERTDKLRKSFKKKLSEGTIPSKDEIEVANVDGDIQKITVS